MITPKNLLNHELIGLQAEITDSRDATLVGVKGKIVDETQQTFTVRKDDGREIKAAKQNQTFIFKLPGGTKVSVEGKLLKGDPVERLKKKQPRKWD